MLSPSFRNASFALLISPLVGLLAGGCGGGTDTTGETTTTTTTSSMVGTGGSGGATATSSASGTGGTGGGTGGGSMGCMRKAGPADGPRKVVVSHPYDAAANKSTKWEVLDLDAAGVLSKTGTLIDMGRAYWGEVVFTPDGKVGIVVQEDGTLGVLRFDEGSTVSVVHAAFQGKFYAGSVVMDPSGDGAYVLDPNWRNNGGGLYRIAIGCDGVITDLGIVAPSKLAYGMVRLGSDPSRAILASADVLTSKAGDNAHLIDLGGAAPSILAGALAFPDTDAIVSSVARTHDDHFALIADNAEFSPPNRVAVVAVNAGGTLAPVQIITSIEDPLSIVTSPFDNAALVVSGYGNAMFALGYDPASATAPFVVKGEVSYVGKAPELPSNAVMIDRGALRGRVYVSETSAVRQARFEADGSITDLGAFSFGSGLENIVGAIGVTP